MQKNNKQFTYGQTVQKKTTNNLPMDRQCKKKQQTIYLWTDSAKKTALEHLQCSRQCKNNNLPMDRQCKKNCTGAFTVLQTVQKQQFTYGQTVQKKTTTIYIWTDSAKKNNNSNLHMDRQCKKQQQFTHGQYIFTDCTEDNVQNTHTYTQYA